MIRRSFYYSIQNPTLKNISKGWHRRCLTSSILLLLPLTATSKNSCSSSGADLKRTLSTERHRSLNHHSQSSRRIWSQYQPNRIMSTTTVMNGGAVEYKLPSTMTGPPVCSLIEPGHCQFTSEWTSVPLLERFRVSPTTVVLRFGLPDTTKPLQLSTCACILAHTKMDDDEDVIRPYTPISTNADIGYFDLLVKHYGPNSKMSRHMHDVMKIGDTLDFKHIEFNVKIQAPFNHPSHICMLVGGTGITPMIQALHAILGSTTNGLSSTKVTMLYGSKFANDILGYEILEQWSKNYSDRLNVVHILSDEPNDTSKSTWTGLRGYINKDYIEQYVPKPNDNPLIFICGPPPMYNALSGPREEKDVTGLLGTMGYKTEHVYKF